MNVFRINLFFLCIILKSVQMFVAISTFFFIQNVLHAIFCNKIQYNQFITGKGVITEKHINEMRFIESFISPK